MFGERFLRDCASESAREVELRRRGRSRVSSWRRGEGERSEGVRDGVREEVME